jgi:hypothetical protein
MEEITSLENHFEFCIGEVFLKTIIQNSNNFIIHSQQLQEFLEFTQNLSEKKQKFENFLTTQKEKCGLSYEEFITSPLKRIPIYENLLLKLTKLMPINHKHYNKLHEAYKKISQLKNDLESQEQKRNISIISKKLKKPNLVQQGRSFIKEEILSETNSDTQWTLYLFSDILLMKKHSGLNEKIVRSYNLDNIKIELTDGNQHNFKLIVDAKITYMFHSKEFIALFKNMGVQILTVDKHRSPLPDPEDDLWNMPIQPKKRQSTDFAIVDFEEIPIVKRKSWLDFLISGNPKSPSSPKSSSNFRSSRNNSRNSNRSNSPNSSREGSFILANRKLSRSYEDFDLLL